MKQFILALFIFISMSGNAFADNISLTADIWAPYTMDSGSGKDGYLIDIARAAFRLEGHNVTYEVRPFSRGIMEVSNGKFDGVVGIYRQDAVDAGFVVPENDLGVSINTFFVRKDDSWKYSSQLKAKSFEGKSIGVIKDYVFAEIQDYLQANRNTHKVQYIHGETPLETNLKKLLGKRIDITIDDEVVVLYTAKQMGIVGQIRSAGSLSSKNKVTIGFSPKNPEEEKYADILSKGIHTLRQSGELEKILAKYELTDWETKAD